MVRCGYRTRSTYIHIGLAVCALSIIPRIHHGENQSERTIVCLPETNARPLLAISDPIIKEKAIIKCMERLNGEIGAGMTGCIALHYYSVVWLAVCAQSIVWFCERYPHRPQEKSIVWGGWLHTIVWINRSDITRTTCHYLNDSKRITRIKTYHGRNQSERYYTDNLPLSQR